MSISVASRISSERSMYASLVATTTRSPFNFGSPKSSPRLARAKSPNPRKCNAMNHSPSPCRETSSQNLVKTTENNVFKKVQPTLGCQKCHDNQTLVNSMNNLSIMDTKNGKDLKLKEKILKSVDPLPITSTELAVKLADNSTQKPLIIDCRSFISYNLCHIRNALNVGCADRLTKKRLQSGKITLTQMIKCSLAKERFMSHKGVDVVVYDDSTTATSENDSSLRILMTSLLREGKTVYFLQGGLAEFHNRYEEYCEEPQAVANAPLYSPTTPAIVSDEIDTAIASQVLPFLYIGNERDAANKERLKELHITHVLNITSHIPLYFEKEGINYHRLPASDSGRQNLKQYFLEASEFIDAVKKEGGKVLIHCQAGVSRSATITMAYIMKHSKLTLHEIYKYVKSKRSIIAPNFNFMGQLMEFEQSLNEGKTSRDEEICLDISKKCL